ncbi:DMT family transporter [Ideonella sp. A 288]|uniref:DMT family transporter n=1 Tax=Ideonella sp. A 288 TaxID=1962181 RepID=UPI000B4A7BD9|nr:DMT family transporter [Ideonella sp. A 288]
MNEPGPSGPPVITRSFRVGPVGPRGLLLATMAAWGLNLPVMKLLLPVFGPMGTSLWRMLAACALLSAVTWTAARRWPRLEARQWAMLALCGAVMVYANQVFLMQGMRRTTASNAALIMALNPLLSSLLAALTLRVPVTGLRLAGVALGFGGVALVILNRPGALLGSGGLGDLLVLGAVATWVAGGVMVQRLADRRAGGLDSGTVSWAVNLAGTLLLALHVLVAGDPLVLPGATVTPGLVAMLVASGLLATAAGALVWNRALSVLGVAHVSLYVYWVPIFGVAFSVLLLGEALTVWHGVGLAAVLGGTWLGTRRG